MECAACGHDTLLPASALLQGATVAADYPLCSTWNPGSGAVNAMLAGRRWCQLKWGV
jgi:hypothetical protein